DTQSPITLKFPRTSRPTHEAMAINRAELLESTAKTIEENGIRSPYSPDLRPLFDRSLTGMPKPAPGSRSSRDPLEVPHHISHNSCPSCARFQSLFSPPALYRKNNSRDPRLISRLKS